MKRTLSLLLILAMLLALTACSGVPAETPGETTVPAESAETTEATEVPSLRMPMEVTMPEFGPREDVEIPADAGISLAGTDTILTEPVRGSSAGPLDPLRPYYGMGTCTSLTNDPHILYMFVSDNESAWTNDEAVNFINSVLSPGVWWLEDEAAKWGVDVNIGATYYLGTGDGICHYDGILDDCDAGGNSDILEQVAVSLGFQDKEQLYQMTQYWTGREEVLFLIIPNKPGRSYAFMDGVNDEYVYMEHCVVFGQNKYVEEGVYPACAATAAHEILHCFGAEDYYIQDTTRRQIAESYFPNDIMLTIYMDDIRYNSISHYTAYTVGWTDSVPNVCYDDNWWT